MNRRDSGGYCWGWDSGYRIDTDRDENGDPWDDDEPMEKT